ncbi:cellulose binding domain-containing protein [Actinoplanes derwentensis]|uniref:Cellulose binding domain-containing protein n=1 Tax=Actinoplanes derwentensis TaxID=113562 RepID=A0A1H2DE06_9ACTN|nr:cellulose binding domain-containing protein [Actinoplanes derwentensis]GID84842.1 hypothetical protein Ade03nite_37660 [Actinoplanes derwentensis]SDT80970.1 Cellulose binding domain-containing protein [Actinoplanes derwentensis]
MTKRRTPADVVRDAAWRLATAMLTSPSPEPRLLRPAGTPARRPMAGRLMLVAGVLAAVTTTALLVVFLVDRPFQDSVQPEQAAGLPGRTEEPIVAASSGPPAPDRTRPAAASPSASASVSASAGTTPLSPSAPVGSPVPSRGDTVPLAAGYTTTPYLVGLLGYRTQVTVTNPGTAARTGWTLAVTLPRSTLWVDKVEGATASQQGAVWTFTPDETTAEISAAGQVGISFEVHGATLLDAAPADCRIDGAACTS